MTPHQKCCIYVRVSNEKLNLDNQLPPLQQIAKQRGFEVVEVIQEQLSGSKTSRKGIQKLLQGAHQGLYQHVLVWALDRLGRDQADVITTVTKLDSYGCNVVSHQESWLDLKGPTRGLLLGVFAWWAQQERERLIERTRAGLATARVNGTKLGRPKKAVDLDQAYKLLKSGLSYAQTAKKLNIGVGTLHRAVQEERAA